MSTFIKSTFFSLAFLLFLSPAMAAEPTFSDLSANDEHFLEIEYLVARDVIDGYEDGTFQSHQQITRAELVKLMVAMQGIEPDPEVYQGCFADIDDGWEAPYVCYAKEMEWIHGYSDGYFRSDRFVNWSETLKIVLNPLFKYEIAQITADDIAKYAENSPFAEDSWFAPYATHASMTNVKDGWDMDEMYKATRGDVSGFISNSLVYHENDLDVYHDYFRDDILREQGYGDLISRPTDCYHLEALEFDFYSDYLESEYALIPPYNSFYSYYPSSFPRVDLGHFCSLHNEDFLFSLLVETEEGKMIKHLIRFDQNGVLLKDQAVFCNSSSERPHPLFSPYYSNDMIPKDPNSMELVDCSFFKDEYGVYYDEDLVIEQVDPDSFVSLGFPYSKDANHAYYRNSILEGIDPQNFERVGPKDFDDLFPFDYARDAEQVLFEGHVFEGVDLSTFEPLLDGYSKDKDHVYYREAIMPEADPETFQIFERPFGDYVSFYYDMSIASDEHYIYEHGEIADWFDDQTMENINGLFLLDDEHVYYNNGIDLEALDSVTDTPTVDDFSNFEVIEEAPVLDGSWLKAEDRIFLMHVHLIEVTDADSFEFIDAVYSRDQFNVFHLEDRQGGWTFLDIPGADPATFEPLTPEDHEFNLGKDGQAIYQNLKTLDTGDLDVATAYFDEKEKVLKDVEGYVCDQDMSGLFEDCSIVE